MNWEEIITKLKKEFNFLALDEEVWEKLAKEVRIKAIHCPKDKYFSFVENYLMEKLVPMTREYLETSTGFLTITNNYIALNIPEETSYRLVIRNILRLLNFYSLMGFTPSLINILDLVSTSKEVQNMLKIIVEANLNYIQKGGFDSIDNPVLSALIEAYCTLNGIEIMPISSDDIKLGLNNLKIASEEGGLYLSELDLQLLTPEEEFILAYKATQNDPAARQTLIGRSLPLVIYIANKFLANNFSLDDLIQEGNIGLIQAVDSFELAKGIKFSNYAALWIKESMRRAIYNTRIITIPEHMQLLFNQYVSVQDNLRNKLFREPSLDEIALEMGISKKKVEVLKECDKSIISLNSLDNDEDIASWLIPREEASVEEMACEIQRGDCDNFIASCNLKEQESEVIKLYFGFDTTSLTLQEIADMKHVSKERIRKVTARSLAKFRENEMADSYVDYMDYPDQAYENLAILREYYRIDHRNRFKSFTDILYRKTPEEKAKIKSELQRIPDYEYDHRNLYPEKIISLYDYFANYYPEYIDIMLAMLSDYDREIVHLRFGDDLNNPVPSPKWNSRYEEIYKQVVIPRMRGLLYRYFILKDASPEEHFTKTAQRMKIQDTKFKQLLKPYKENKARTRKR